MFRFRKVREPEQTDENVSTFEELANHLDELVQTARKDKSLLNHYAGNESQRVVQIGQAVATFEQSAQKISDFEVILKNVKKEIKSIQTEVKNLQVLKSKTAELFNQLFQLKSQLKVAEKQQKPIQKSAEEFNIFLEKADRARADIILKLDSIDSKQFELLDKYDDFLQRMEKSEDQLGRLSSLQAEFERITENVATESARITIWMTATEKMSEKFKKATELFETTKQKIDRFHELAEYLESKTKSLSKQKELLKNAYIEAGKANAIFWEIKSKYSELEQDVEKIKKMETQTSRFDSELESIVGRV
jgi:DNA repair ATPase RecN